MLVGSSQFSDDVLLPSVWSARSLILTIWVSLSTTEYKNILLCAHQMYCRMFTESQSWGLF